MTTRARALKLPRFEVSFNRDAFILAALWLVIGFVSTYLTTQSTEAQISGKAFCSLFGGAGYSFHNMAMIGHCPWCYAAAAAFTLSAASFLRRL